MIELPPQKGGGITHMTGLLQWMTVNSSEEAGKEGQAVGQLCLYFRGCLNCLELSDVMTGLNVSESGERPTRQIMWRESFIDHLTG